MQVSIFAFLGDGAGRSPVDAYVETLSRMRDEGFARMWTAQLPHQPDLLTTLAIALREVDGIEVGTGVLPIQLQHPMALAQRALTVNLIAAGRLTVGLGMSHRLVRRAPGGSPGIARSAGSGSTSTACCPCSPGRRPRRWARRSPRGGAWSFRGRLVIPGAPAPDVYVAALGPQMLRLAGRRTAGTVTWMTGPRTLAEHVGPTLRGATEEVGRTVRVVASLPVAVTDDVDAARARAAEQFAIYGKLPSYRAMLDREGFPGPEDAALIGDEKAVAHRVDELRDAGVDEFVALPFGASEEERAGTRALLRTL